MTTPPTLKLRADALSSTLPWPIRVLRYAAGCGLLLLLLFLLTGALDAWFIHWLAGRFENGFRQLWWLNPHVGKLVGAVLLGVGGPLYFRLDAFCPQWLGKKVGAFFRWSGIVAFITHGFALAGTQEANFGETGEVLRFYAIDPDNTVRWSYYDRINPLTGARFQPVTPAVALELRQREHISFSEVSTALDAPWFSPGTGTPLLWFSEHADGTRHFFNLPGFDPVTAQSLTPVTPALRAKLEADVKTATATRAREEAERQAQAKATAEAEREKAAAARAQAEQARARLEAEMEVKRRAAEAEAKRRAELEAAERKEQQAKAEAKAAAAARAKAAADEAAAAEQRRRAPQSFTLRYGQELNIHGSGGPCRITVNGPVQCRHRATGVRRYLDVHTPMDFAANEVPDWAFMPDGYATQLVIHPD